MASGAGGDGSAAVGRLRIGVGGALELMLRDGAVESWPLMTVEDYAAALGVKLDEVSAFADRVSGLEAA